jgi:hypothetical protein
MTFSGRLAEIYWHIRYPKLVAEWEAQGRLPAMLLEAQRQAESQLLSLRLHFMQQGLPPQQAHDRAWQIVRERYLLYPPEF